MLTLQAALSQENVLSTNQSYAVYALFKLIPEDGPGQTPTQLPLNLALVIDNSGSMHDKDNRIQLALTAASQAVKALKPTDLISIIAFSDEAALMLPATPAGNFAQINQAIQNVIRTPAGGTNIPVAMQMAAEQLKRSANAQFVNRALLLTDGRTGIDKEPQCVQIAAAEVANKISFSTFGLGHDWNENLLKTISDRSQGSWYYIQSPQQIAAIFQQEFGVLLTTAYSDVQLKLKFFKPDEIREARIVSPDIRDLTVQADVPNKTSFVLVGSMQANVPLYVLVTVLLTPRNPGEYNLAMVSLLYNQAGQPRQISSAEGLPINFVTDPNLVFNNGEVLRWVDMQQVDKMVRRATQLAASGDVSRATQLFETARNISDKTGDRRKTQLISDAIQELGGTGAISRKTQLGAIDGARKTNIMPDEF